MGIHVVAWCALRCFLFVQEERMFFSGKAVARRAQSSKKAKAKQEKHWTKRVTENDRLTKQYDRTIVDQQSEERTRREMWEEEHRQLEIEERNVRAEEDDLIRFQVQMRDHWLGLLKDCPEADRIKKLSWVRGVAQGMYSYFHLVKDAVVGKEYVVKYLLCPSTSIEQRLLTEALIYSKVVSRSKNLVQLNDAFTHGIFPHGGAVRAGAFLFIVMEYCRGNTLFQKLQLGHTPTSHEIWRWLLQSASALAALHAKKVSHDNVR